MLTQILENLPADINTIPLEAKFHNTHVEYGFEANVVLKASWKGGSCDDKRRDYTCTNKMTLFGRFYGELVSDVNLLDGYNDELVQSAAGTLKSDASGKIGVKMPSQNLGEAAAAAHHHVFESSNMITPIYNLLCMYYLRSLEIKAPYDPEGCAFDDGKFKIANKDMYGVDYRCDLSKFGGLVAVDDPVERIVLEDSLSACEGEYTSYFTNLHDTVVVALPPYTPRGQMNALLVALSGWESQNPFGIGHSRPKCSNKVAFTGPAEQPESAGPFTKVDIKAAIRSLVTENRLYLDFSYAMGMFLQVLMTPVPRRVESTPWLSVSRKVQLPRARCVRGLSYAGIVSGKPYYKAGDYAKDLAFWTECDGAVVPASMLLAEATHLSLAALAAATPESQLNTHNYHEKASGYRLNAGTPMMNDLLLFGMHSGTYISPKEVSQCGMVRLVDLGSEAQPKIRVLYHSKEDLGGYIVEKDKTKSLEAAEKGSGKAAKGDEKPKAQLKQAPKLQSGLLVVRKMASPVYPVYLYGKTSAFGLPGWRSEKTIRSVASSHSMMVLKDPELYAYIANFCSLAGWVQTPQDLIGETTKYQYNGDVFGRHMALDWLLPPLFLVATRSETLRRQQEYTLAQLWLEEGSELSIDYEDIKWCFFAPEARGKLSAITPAKKCDFFRDYKYRYGSSGAHQTATMNFLLSSSALAVARNH